MIKIYCDKCGECIDTLVYQVPKTEYIKNSMGQRIGKFEKNNSFVCEKCYKLEPSFEIGDEVITATGQKGWIVDICKCNNCKSRGFYELKVKIESGIDKYIYITDADKRDGFSDFYRIGNYFYRNINKQELLSQIADKKQELNKNMVDCDALLCQLKTLIDLK